MNDKRMAKQNQLNFDELVEDVEKNLTKRRPVPKTRRVQPANIDTGERAFAKAVREIVQKLRKE